MTLRTALGTWSPPLLLMAVIFVLSAQQQLATDLGVIDLIGRKIVHAVEYAVLCLLWWRALRTVMSPGRAVRLAFVISVLYAISDEVHQTFVPGRHGWPVDVVIDTAGAALAARLAHRRGSRAG